MAFIIPKFDVSKNVFILRYGFNENNKIDYLSKYKNEFSNFIENSKWNKFYEKNNNFSIIEELLFYVVTSVQN